MVSPKRPTISGDESRLKSSPLEAAPSALLRTPLEVRSQIYDDLLPYPVVNHINLLCVCKELRNEVQKYIYKRPLTFLSQEGFFQWIEKHDDAFKRANLKQVHTLRLKVLDIGPDEIQEAWMRTAFQCADSNEPTIDSEENPYRIELERIVSGLKMMPNILDFTIYKPSTEHSPTCDVYEAIFRFVKKEYPQLRKLTLYIDKMPLTFLPPLKNLRSLLFTGFSVSSEHDTLEYLKKLPKLEELSLCGPPRNLSFRQRTGYKGDRIMQCIKPRVLKELQPLKSIIICEIYDMIRSGPAFFTVGMLSSIQETHSNSLQNLELSTDLKLPDDVQSVIASLLLASNSLKYLKMAWINMIPKILEALPSTLHKLEIAAHCGLCPAEITDALISRSPYLPNLKELVFKVHYGAREAQGLQQNGSEVLSNASVSPAVPWPFMLAVGRELTERRLLGIGCKARWEVWYPGPVESDQGPSQAQRSRVLGGETDNKSVPC